MGKGQSWLVVRRSLRWRWNLENLARQKDDWKLECAASSTPAILIWLCTASDRQRPLKRHSISHSMITRICWYFLPYHQSFKWVGTKPLIIIWFKVTHNWNLAASVSPVLLHTAQQQLAPPSFRVATCGLRTPPCLKCRWIAYRLVTEHFLPQAHAPGTGFHHMFALPSQCTLSENLFALVNSCVHILGCYSCFSIISGISA